MFLNTLNLNVGETNVKYLKNKEAISAHVGNFTLTTLQN